jgi:hypothetical protein
LQAPPPKAEGLQAQAYEASPCAAIICENLAIPSALGGGDASAGLRSKPVRCIVFLLNLSYCEHQCFKNPTICKIKILNM